MPSGPAISRKRRVDPTPASESPEPAPQRRRTSPSDPEDEDEDEGEEEEEEAVENSTGGDGGGGGVEQMVKKMVRFALACEHQRRPIRRADVSEKVLKSASASAGAGRRFKEVFARAQVELRAVFGMEMVEMPTRERVTVAQKRAAAAKNSQTKPTVSWMLVSLLPAQFRDPQILRPPTVLAAAEESKYTALYTMLVSLIMLSGNALPEAKMERFLARLGLTDNTPLGHGCEKTERLLKRMEKDGYVVKVKETTGVGEDDVYWVVGPRGKVEVGEDGVAGLVKTIYAPAGEGETEDLEKKIARSLGIGERAGRRNNGETREAGGPPKRRGRPKRNDRQREEEDEDEESSGGEDE